MMEAEKEAEKTLVIIKTLLDTINKMHEQTATNNAAIAKLIARLDANDKAIEQLLAMVNSLDPRRA